MNSELNLTSFEFQSKNKQFFSIDLFFVRKNAALDFANTINSMEFFEKKSLHSVENFEALV